MRALHHRSQAGSVEHTRATSRAGGADPLSHSPGWHGGGTGGLQGEMLSSISPQVLAVKHQPAPTNQEQKAAKLSRSGFPRK